MYFKYTIGIYSTQVHLPSQYDLGHCHGQSNIELTGHLIRKCLTPVIPFINVLVNNYQYNATNYDQIGVNKDLKDYKNYES